MTPGGKKGGPAFLPGSFSQGLEVGFHVFPGNLLVFRFSVPAPVSYTHLLKDPNIKNKEGRTVFDISAFDFTKDKPAPDTAVSYTHLPMIWSVSCSGLP